MAERPFEGARTRTLISIYVFVAIALAKMAVGWAFGFQIILADGIHNLADSLMMVAAYIGILLAQRPFKRTSLFPYGLYKGENLISLFMSIAIAAGAVEVLFEGLRPARAASPLVPTALEIGSMAAIALLGYWVSKVSGGLSVVTAEVVHNYQDAVVSIIVIAGVFLEYYGLRYLYLVALVIVVAYLVYQAIYLAKDSVMTLLDASDARVERRISAVMSSISGIVGFHELKVRKSGPYYFVEMHLELPRSVSVEEADAIADEVEARIKASEPMVLGVTIHVEPGAFSGRWNVAVSANKEGVVAPLSEADYIYIYRAGDGGPAIFQNPIKSVERRRIVALIDFLKQNSVNALITGGVETPATYALKGAGVDVYISGQMRVEEAIARFRSGEFKAPAQP